MGLPERRQCGVTGHTALRTGRAASWAIVTTCCARLRNLSRASIAVGLSDRLGTDRTGSWDVNRKSGSRRALAKTPASSAEVRYHRY